MASQSVAIFWNRWLMFNIAIFTFSFNFAKIFAHCMFFFFWLNFCLSLEKYLFYFVNNGVRVLKALLHLTPLYSHNDMPELFCEFSYIILCCAINWFDLNWFDLNCKCLMNTMARCMRIYWRLIPAMHPYTQGLGFRFRVRNGEMVDKGEHNLPFQNDRWL